jgi:predicted transposase YdaD
VLVNILPPNSSPHASVEIANFYQSTCYGLTARQDYRVINLWEVEVELVFEQPIPSLLPFVPILKGGGNESQVRQALRQLRQTKSLEELEPLLAFFATFVLDSELVQQIMRWDMAVLLESPWYRQILQEGEKRGEKRGEEQGKKAGLLSGIATILELKFGVNGLQLMAEIQTLDQVELLEAVLTSLKTVESLEELRLVYGFQSSNSHNGDDPG